MFLANLFGSFLTSATVALRALSDAVEAGDWETLTREAHRFKGEASTLGVTGVASLLGELESLGAPLDRSTARALVARTAQEMERVSAALRAALDGAAVP